MCCSPVTSRDTFITQAIIFPVRPIQWPAPGPGDDDQWMEKIQMGGCAGRKLAEDQHMPAKYLSVNGKINGLTRELVQQGYFGDT